VDLVIFLWDPIVKQLHDPYIVTLLKVCDIHNIPLATILKSAEILLKEFLQIKMKKLWKDRSTLA